MQWAAVLLLFVAGVLTSLTPCIYPMIPITAAIVRGQSVGDTGASRLRRPVALTVSYVLGLAIVYATPGLVAGLTGTLFGSASSNPWAYFAMANLLMLFALVMLDAVPVPIPSPWLMRASRAGSGGSMAGGFVMGAGIPVGRGTMLGAGDGGRPDLGRHDTRAMLGFIYLFVFSIGLCTFLVIAGLSTGALARLPRAGAWMQ